MDPDPTPAPAPAIQPKLAVIQEACFAQNAPGDFTGHEIKSRAEIVCAGFLWAVSDLSQSAWLIHGTNWSETNGFSIILV